MITIIVIILLIIFIYIIAAFCYFLYLLSIACAEHDRELDNIAINISNQLRCTAEKDEHFDLDSAVENLDIYSDLTERDTKLLKHLIKCNYNHPEIL